MVKQFTVPCKFGQETSPVTLYIGHPDSAHHPVHFQSEWLLNTKGGVIPQDLMNTLQKLHNLAKENGADFENLCYYALISATEHSINGVTPSEINKYANEFIENENNNLQKEEQLPSNNKNNSVPNITYNKEDEDILLLEDNDYQSQTKIYKENKAKNKVDVNNNKKSNTQDDIKKNNDKCLYTKEDEDILF